MQSNICVYIMKNTYNKVNSCVLFVQTPVARLDSAKHTRTHCLAITYKGRKVCWPVCERVRETVLLKGELNGICKTQCIIKGLAMRKENQFLKNDSTLDCITTPG